MPGARCVLLDRDGTINVDRGYVHRIADWEFLPGAIEAIRQLKSNGYLVAVVTNQSGIGKGLYERSDVDQLHTFVRNELARNRVSLDAIAVCPHQEPDGCDCRKPNTGLIKLVADQTKFELDFANSWTIGDKPSDVAFGKALGTRTALLQSSYWSAEQLSCDPDHIAESLREAADLILKSNYR